MSAPLPRLLRHLRHRRRRVLAAGAASVLNKIFDLAPPALIGAAVDVVVERQGSLIAQLGFPGVRDQLLLLSALTVLVWGLESVFEYLYAWLWRNLAQAVQHELRMEAYAHVQELDVAWYSGQSSGGLMAVLNDDINQLERFLDGGANDLIQVATTAVVVSASFFAISGTIAALAVAPIPVVLWGSFRFQARIAPRYATVRERVGALNAVLSDNLAGIATIKSFTAEAREVARVGAASEDYLRANRAAIALSAAFSPLIRMAIVVGFTATLLVGGLQVIDGALAVGAYSVLIFLTQRLLWPLTRLGNTFDLYQRAMASTARVLDLIDTPAQVEDGGASLPAGGARGEVSFEGVTFGYPGRAPLFTGFDLRIPAGRTVAIVGPTGSGKSTLLRLLLRFHDVGAGRVGLDGVDVSDLRLASLRGAVALVDQRTFLFPGSVRENIAYGRPEAGLDAIEAAARLADAHDFIRALPAGYDTEVGERGARLSGGQRQRLAIARAVLKDAPILALDEATSAVDNETEAAIQRSIRRLSQGRTVIVIAHRLSTIRHADEIVVLQGGAITERGGHEALVDAGGVYARMWRIQTGEIGEDEKTPSALSPRFDHSR